MNTDVVVVEGLNIEDPSTGRTLVDSLSFTIGRGQCVGLVGESGSGKSITARSLLGLGDSALMTRADRLEIFGDDLREASERTWRGIRGRRIGYVLQDALGSLDPLRRIESEVGEALRVHAKLGRTERRDRVFEALRSVGFPSPASRSRQRSAQLSGGLRQRALIASALVTGPELLIADEPTTALDVTIQAGILDLLHRVTDEGTSLLIVSHDIAVINEIADTVIVLQNGTVRETGPAQQVLNDPQDPYTQTLIRSLPSVRTRGRSLIGGESLAPVSEASKVLVKTSDLVRSFVLADRTRIPALDHVSIEVREGEILGVVGESGSGKSTLARTLIGAEAQESGTIEYVGAPEGFDPKGSALVQLISQDPLGAFDPRYTVTQILDEAIALDPAFRTADAAARDERAISLLGAVGLPESVLAQHPRKLSGGQRQRVAIARAVATSPRLLICDEPVSALDSSVQAQVLDLLLELRAKLELTVLFISHDIGVIAHLSDRLLVMRNGKVVEEGPTARILTDPAHQYTRLLIESVPGARAARRGQPKE